MRYVSIFVLCLTLSCVVTVAHARPRVALVLGGGGARGAAHVGVLEVLERERVAVDCVAGTSMGALVAGAYARGLKPAEMRQQLGDADWVDMFQDNPAYSELDFRYHRISQSFLPGSEMGLTDNGVQYQSGVVVGQKIKLFFNRLVKAERGEPQIEHLALPLAMVATDIGSGERVVFRSGSLTQGMRASMSVPGLLAPVEIQGRKLVDGGLVDNLPIAEARDLCKADRVIAVDVGSPLLKAEEVGSMLSVSAQMVNILTGQNVARSLMLLDKDRDLYIQPDLTGYTAGDFTRNAGIIDRGRAAAEALLPRLKSLQLTDTEFAVWQQRFKDKDEVPPPIQRIEFAQLNHVNPKTMQRHITSTNGDGIDPARIDRDLLRMYGDGDYQSVDYMVLREHDKSVLRITPVEKPWGPDYLRFGMKLESVIGNNSSFGLRAALHKTWLNSLGGQLLLTGELGQSSALGVNFYQPLEPQQRYFFEPELNYRRHQHSFYLGDQRIAEFQVRKLDGFLSMGRNVAAVGQVRAGWLNRMVEYEFNTGLPIIRSARDWVSGPMLMIDSDQFDRLYFPQKGWAFKAQVFDARNHDYTKLTADLKSAYTLGNYVLSAQIRYAGAIRGSLPVFDAATLGGFRNLSGFFQDQLSGEHARFGSLHFERIIGRLPLGLRGDLRAGITQEIGRVDQSFVATSRTGWQLANALYLGGETPLGVMYLGWGHVRNASSHWYLFFGTP